MNLAYVFSENVNQVHNLFIYFESIKRKPHTHNNNNNKKEKKWRRGTNNTKTNSILNFTKTILLAVNSNYKENRNMRIKTRKTEQKIVKRMEEQQINHPPTATKISNKK